MLKLRFLFVLFFFMLCLPCFGAGDADKVALIERYMFLVERDLLNNVAYYYSHPVWDGPGDPKADSVLNDLTSTFFLGDAVLRLYLDAGGNPSHPLWGQYLQKSNEFFGSAGYRWWLLYFDSQKAPITGFTALNLGYGAYALDLLKRVAIWLAAAIALALTVWFIIKIVRWYKQLAQ